MKISKLVLAIWLAANAWAQAPPVKPQASQPAVAKPGAAQGAKKAPAAAPTTATGKPAATSKPAVATKPADRAATPALPSSASPYRGGKGFPQRASAPGAAAPVRTVTRKGERDPFVSPIVERSRVGGNCIGTGRQCLLVGDIGLQGIVRYAGGYIAVVINGEHTYFLREKDPLADGDVERITRNEIILRQRSSDMFGRPVVHEVTRKLGTPAA